MKSSIPQSHYSLFKSHAGSGRLGGGEGRGDCIREEGSLPLGGRGSLTISVHSTFDSFYLRSGVEDR